VGNVDALVVCAEAVHDVVGRGLLDRRSGAVAVQSAELKAWAELVCGGDARGFDLADGYFEMLEKSMMLILTPALAWLTPRRARSRIAMKSMLKSR